MFDEEGKFLNFFGNDWAGIETDEPGQKNEMRMLWLKQTFGVLWFQQELTHFLILQPSTFQSHLNHFSSHATFQVL